MNNQRGQQPQWLLQDTPGQSLFRQPISGQPLSVQPASPGSVPRPPLTLSQFKTPLPANHLREPLRQPLSQFKTPLPANRPMHPASEPLRQPLSQFKKNSLPAKPRTQFKPGLAQSPSYSMLDTAKQFAVAAAAQDEEATFLTSLYSMLDTAKQLAYPGPDVAQSSSYPVPGSAQPFVHPGRNAPQTPPYPVINTPQPLASSASQPHPNLVPHPPQRQLYVRIPSEPGRASSSPARSAASQRAPLRISPEPEGTPSDLKSLLQRRVAVPLWTVLASVVLSLSLLSVVVLAGSAGLLPGGSSRSTASSGQTATATDTNPTATGTATDPSQSTPTPGLTQGPPWTTIQSFKGNSNKQTPKFTVPSDWRLAWTCDPSSFAVGQYNVQIYVYNADGTPLDIAVDTLCQPGTTGDFVEEHQGGTISLGMNSPGAWTMQVQVVK